MAGLNSAVQAPMQPMAEGAQGLDEFDGDAATPEEQAMYDQIVKNAMRVISPDGDTVAPELQESLSASDNPVLNLAMTTVSVVSGLVSSAQQAGQKIPGDILLPAGAEILELLVEEAEALKLHDYSEEDMERAWYLAVDMYREQAKAAGTLDEEALKADFAELEQAEAEGRLDEMIPGARERAEQMAASQPEMQQPGMEQV